MLRRARWALLMSTGLAWLAWGVAFTHIRGPLLGDLLCDLLRCVAVILTIAWVLARMVHPFVATARSWFEVGKSVQCQDCRCTAIQRATKAPVVPLRLLVSRDDSVKLRGWE